MIEADDPEPTQGVSGGGAGADARADGLLLALLLKHQRRTWRQGEPTTVEAYLAQQPGLRDAQQILVLIYQEVVLREEAGESPQLEEYLRRFPELAPQLELQFEVEAAIRGEDPGPGEGQNTLIGRPGRAGLPAAPTVP